MFKNNLYIYLLFCFSLTLIISCENGSVEKDSNTAKQFTLNSITDNKEYSSNEFNGKPLVINFWASWCGPCREEMPFLESWWKENKDGEIKIVGINVNDNKKQALKTLDEFSISYLNLHDPQGNLSNSYGIIALPVTIFIDKKGNIHKQHYGPFLGEEGEKIFNNSLKGIL